MEKTEIPVADPYFCEVGEKITFTVYDKRFWKILLHKIFFRKPPTKIWGPYTVVGKTKKSVSIIPLVAD